MQSIDDQLAKVENKLDTFKTGDIADELKKQSDRRTKTAIAFLLILIADWIMSFFVPILQGRAPFTLEAVTVSFILIFFYTCFLFIAKAHQWLDMRTVKDWLNVADHMDSIRLSDVRKKEMLSIELIRCKDDAKFRQDSLRNLVNVGISLFKSGNGDPVAQRSDWTPLTDSFVKTLKSVDDQLIQREMHDNAVIILEKKLPIIKESLELITKHIQAMEDREKIREESIDKLILGFERLVNEVEKIKIKLV